MVNIKEIETEIINMDGLSRLSFVIEGIIPGTKMFADVYKMDDLKKYYEETEDLENLNPSFYDLLEHYFENDESFSDSLYVAFVKYHEIYNEEEEEELYSIGLAYNMLHDDIHKIIGDRQNSLSLELSTTEWAANWGSVRSYLEKSFHEKQYNDFWYKFLKRKKSVIQ